ncbi:hypothetical protein B0A49_08091, partial [Cryomyces minteri]
PFTAWGALFFWIMIILFNGFAVFTKGNWSVDDFVTAYVGIPIYFAFFLFWKIFKRTSWVKPADADIWTGKAALDNEVWPEQIPRNIFEKIWFWIA